MTCDINGYSTYSKFALSELATLGALDFELLPPRLLGMTEFAESNSSCERDSPPENPRLMQAEGLADCAEVLRLVGTRICLSPMRRVAPTMPPHLVPDQI